METQVSPIILGYDAAQAYLGGVSRSTVKILAGRGELEVVRVNGRTMFTLDGLNQFVQRQRAKRNLGAA